MDLDTILAELKAEHQRLGRMIQAIEGLHGRKTAAPRKRRGRKHMDAAARQAVSQRMKSYWEARKAKTQTDGAEEALPEAQTDNI